jgi:hypothetical protein
MSVRMIAIVALTIIAIFSVNALRHSTLLSGLSSHRQSVDQIVDQIK